MPEIKVRVVDCYVYHQMDGAIQFLILKRNKDKLYEHLWQGVAGKIEKGEKAWQTAIRELKEETALNPKKMFVYVKCLVFSKSGRLIVMLMLFIVIVIIIINFF